MDPPEAMSAPEHESAAAKWKDKLGLTDEQVDKLKAAMKARREAMEPLVKQMKGSMKKLQDQVKAKSADADIQAVLDELEQARQGMRAAMEKFKTDTAFLSATQHAKMMLHYMHHGGMHHGKGAKASPQQQLGTKPAQ
jgi:DNA repair exonuclease SbcCD ATPase subunit